SKSQGIIEVTVKADKAAIGEMKFNYIVHNAGWYPVYDLRSNELGEDINFTYKAMVYQKTGNDWNNVKISLSTGDPNKGNTPPVSQSWNIQYNTGKKYANYSQGQTYQWNQQANLVDAPTR